MNKEEFEKIFKENTITKCLKNKYHKSYKFYSTDERINEIANRRCIYLSDGHNWNDKKDREQFNTQNSTIKNFGLCFSFSLSENIALWMLYGGTKKQGAMLNFTNKQINTCIRNKGIIQLGYFKNKEFEPLLEVQPEDYEICFYDVLYYGKRKAKDINYTIKHSENSLDDISLKLISEQGILKKQYEWSYENETRLVVSLPKKLISKYPMITTAKISIAKGNSVNALKKRIILAPNYNGGFIYNKSKLSQYLDWDLCADCEKSYLKNCDNRKGH